jgi:hypothetical protein
MKTMVRIACALLLAAALPAFGISFSVSRPMIGGWVPSTFDVQVTITGVNEISSATASVGTVSAPMTFSAGDWHATLDISSLARGPQTLQISAIDAVGGTGSTSIPVTYAIPPVLTVTAPTANYVANPMLPIAYTCTSDSGQPCDVTVEVGTFMPHDVVFSSHGNASTQVDLTFRGPQSTSVGISASDGVASSSVTIPIFIEPTPLRRIDEVNGLVIDTDATRTLYVSGTNLVLRNRVDGSDTVIASSTGYASLTANGVVYEQLCPELDGFNSDVHYSAWFWERGAAGKYSCLGPTGPNNQTPWVGVKGRYVLVPTASGVSAGGLAVRDTLTGQTLVSQPYLFGLPYSADLGEEGSLITGPRPTFYRPDGSVQLVPPGAPAIPSAGSSWVRSNGESVLYLPFGMGLPSGQQPLHLERDGVDTALTPLSVLFDSDGRPWGAPDSGFQIRNRNYAFQKLGPTSVAQVWRALDNGPPTQITVTSKSSAVEAMGADGSLLVVSPVNGARLLADASSSVATQVSSNMGQGLYPAFAPYIITGDSVFVLSTDLDASVARLDFAASMGTTSSEQTVSLSNLGSSASDFTVSTSDPRFSQTNDCINVPAPGFCTVHVTFTPSADAGALGSSTTATAYLNVSRGGPVRMIKLVGTAQKSLVTHYYESILNREPDPSGTAFWNSEAQRLASLGVNVNEAWYVMAGYFFNSAEYAAANKTDAQFVTDLYETFFNRAPDPSGMAYWSGQLSGGLPREVVLFLFLFSDEFKSFTQSIFGNTATRPEIDVTVDFFRGVLNRLPDTPSFQYWLGRLRTAQCAGAGAVASEVDSISSSFVVSVEYANRHRTNTQFVTDMYYSFLRRGGDAAGVNFWVNQLNTNAMTADQVRHQFLASPEFTARVQAIVAAGCMQ